MVEEINVSKHMETVGSFIGSFVYQDEGVCVVQSLDIGRNVPRKIVKFSPPIWRR